MEVIHPEPSGYEQVWRRRPPRLGEVPARPPLHLYLLAVRACDVRAPGPFTLQLEASRHFQRRSRRKVDLHTAKPSIRIGFGWTKRAHEFAAQPVERRLQLHASTPADCEA